MHKFKIKWTAVAVFAPFFVGCGISFVNSAPFADLSLAPVTTTMVASLTQQFVTSGGKPPVSYTIESGSGTIDPNTGLFTAPATEGSTVVVATDALGTSASATIRILEALWLSPTIASAERGSAVTLTAKGGLPPYVFSLTSGGGSADASTGVYTAPAEATVAKLQVVDAFGQIAQAAVIVE